MIRNLSARAVRLNAPPWESVGRFIDGHSGLSDSRILERESARRAPEYGIHSSRATAELNSGLTRRGIIYSYIRMHPGAHVRRMARDLRLATGDLQYHLVWLERRGYVKTRKSGFYRFVYPTMVFREEQEVLLGVLSQGTPREILLFLMMDSLMSQGDLARSLGHSQPTVSWHMDRLIQLGIISKRRTGEGVFYEIEADRTDVLSFVKSYHPEVWKRWEARLGNLVVGAGAKLAERGGSLGVRPTPPAVVELIGKR